MVYKVTISYNGYNYNGFQKQSNLVTIQNILEKIISNIFNSDITIYASGRTDAKVHAISQVFHFECSKDINPYNVMLAINTKLPSDIRVQNVEIKDNHFHARFSCKSKVYQYKISYDYLNPFLYQTHLLLRNKLDLNKIIEVSKVFLGTHDFTSFTSSKIHQLKNRVRTIKYIKVIENNSEIIIEIKGNSFLRYMVRMIVAVLIEVGYGRLSKNDVYEMLEKKNKNACRYNAKPNGLYLKEVIYD